jgi:hypothetical protein
MNLERVEKLRHIVPPWMLNWTTGKATSQRYLVVLLAQLRDEDLDRDWSLLSGSSRATSHQDVGPDGETDL